MGSGREPFLEPILRRIRIRKVLPYVKSCKGCSLLDIGCGSNHAFLTEIEEYIRMGVGIDTKVSEVETGKMVTRRLDLDDQLPFPDGHFDMVTMLAVLEHLSKPDDIIGEVARVLRSNGRLFVTVPSPRARAVLEFLSYGLHLVSEEEIRDHKRYYDRDSLHSLVSPNGLIVERHRYFQFGMNNFLVARKGSP